LSQSRLRDSGHEIRYIHEEDLYHVKGDSTTFVFERQLVSTHNGKWKRSAHYSCDLSAQHVLTATVADNMQNYPKRERREAIQIVEARDLNERMGYPSTKNKDPEWRGAQLPVMPQHVLRAGKISKQASAISATTLGPTPVLGQRQQSIEVDQQGAVRIDRHGADGFHILPTCQEQVCGAGRSCHP
jgi:hypothetical protein